MGKQQGGFSAIEAILIVIVVALIGAVGWLFWNQINDKPAEDESSTKTRQEQSTTTTATYSSKETGLAFDYPASWSVKGDSSGYYIPDPDETDAQGGQSKHDHKLIVSPENFTMYFTSRSYGGLGGTGPCDRTATDFQNHGAAPLGASVVSYSIDDAFYLYLTNSDTKKEAEANCFGYAAIVPYTEPKETSDGYSGDPYAIEFGTISVGRYDDKYLLQKPSDKDLKEAVAILKSLRRI